MERAHAASADGAPSRLAVAGEGAPLLLQGGNARAAFALERVWHRHSGGFQTLCSYRGADVETRDSETIRQIYAAHQAVSA